MEKQDLHRKLSATQLNYMCSKFRFFAVACALLAGLLCARAQTTAFTYQGVLTDGGAPANGQYDFQLNVYDSASNGTLVSGPLLTLSTPVTNGLFTLVPDFGAGVFTGSNRWLDIGVRKTGGNGFTTLTTRQQLTAVPYAVYAPSAGTVSGTLALSNLPATLLTITNLQSGAGIILSNASNTVTIIANGASLTNISATANDLAPASNSPNYLASSNPAFTGTLSGPAASIGNLSANAATTSTLVVTATHWTATNYAVTTNDYAILTSTNVTITLPTASLPIGREFLIQNKSQTNIIVTASAIISTPWGTNTSWTLGPWGSTSNQLAVHWDGTNY